MRVIRICRLPHSRAGLWRQSQPFPAIALALLAALFLSLRTSAEEAPIHILSAGIYRPAPVIGGLAPGLRDQTLSGVDRVPLPTLIEATQIIPARLCRSFGLIFARADRAAEPLTIRVTHPLFHRPDGSEGSVDSFDIPAGAGLRYVGFTFSETWEMVAGKWQFTILADGIPLGEVSFAVLPATRTGAEACGTEVSRAGESEARARPARG